MNQSPAMDKSLSVVVPMYHEAENVEHLIDAVHKGLESYSGPWELICVDDGSSDGTGERLKAAIEKYGKHLRVIMLRRNFGQTAAMQTGIDAARGELIATMDGDLQNDPADIPRMIQELQERDLDMIQGWRRERHDDRVRKAFSRVANRLIAKVTGVKLHDYGCSLKIYRAEIIKEVRLFGEMHRFIPVWVAGVTAPSRIGETVVNHNPRIFGTSKYGLSRTFRVVLDLLAVFFFLRFRARPGHFFGSIGLAFGLLGGGILTYLLTVKYALGEDIGSRPLLFVGILLLVASVQLLTTGVIAEMLSRIFYQSEDRQPHSIGWQQDPEQSTWYRAEKSDQDTDGTE
ncbi:MAG: glycosyltransferase family 2 protein [Sedimenticola sp.]